MKSYFRKQNQSLLGEMIRTDFKLRYQGSVLGYLWSLLKPLILFAILYTVFTHFLQIGKGIPNYAVSLLLGIVLWSFFVEATSNALKSIVSRGSLIRKISIPRYLIPISTVFSSLINLLLNLIVVFIFVIFTENNALSWETIVIFPLLLFELLVFSISIGFFLSALYVKYRDIEHIWEIAKQALFYTVPIIYPLSRIPSEEIKKMIMLNPLAQIIQGSRSVVTYSETETIKDIWPNPLVLLVPLAIIVVTAIVSSLYFRKRSKFFAEDI